MKKQHKTNVRTGSFMIFCLLAMSIIAKAQSGLSCATAKNFPAPINGLPAAETQTNASQWYQFVAQTEQAQISIYEKNPAFSSKLNDIALLSGTCGSYTILSIDSISDPMDSIFTINASALLPGTTYYVRVNKFPGATATTTYFPTLRQPQVGCVGCHDPVVNNCNLVCNGNFEYNGGSIPSLNSQISLACPWNMASEGTSDYFHAQSSNSWTGIPNNYFGNQPARSGNAYAGFYAYAYGTYVFPGYHEYIYQPLRCTLIAGVTYELTFYVNLSDSSRFSVSSLGAVLVEGLGATVLPFSQWYQFNVPFGTTKVMNTSGFISDKAGWTAITGTFVATGREEDIMIGDFGTMNQATGNANPANIDTLMPIPPLVDNSRIYFAYYYVEDVSLTPVNTMTISATDYNICPFEPVMMENSFGVPINWAPGSVLDCSTDCIDPIVHTSSSTTISGTITYCSGCTYTDTAHIDVVSVTANAGADVTICSGGTDLTATGGGTYLWSTGATTATIHVNPSVTTTYSVTVTDSEGCHLTNTDAVTVFVIPPTTTATASNSTIPLGCSSTLSASSSASSNYTWMPGGMTGASVNVSPMSTTTYTVTGTTAEGCVSTATVTVNVTTTPFTVAGNITACAGMSVYSVSSSITMGVTYTWTTSTGLSGSGSTANVNFNLTGGGTITFTGTYASGCTYSASLHVAACCKASSEYITINGPAVSSALASFGTLVNGTIVITNQFLAINGMLIVNQNLTLKGCDVRMGYLSNIFVRPGVTLTITNNTVSDKTHIYACNDMWDGIYVQSPTASLIINNGSTIEDALNAVVSDNKGNFQINSSAAYGNVIFNKNYKSIVVKDAVSHPGLVNKTTIQCYDGVPGGNPVNTGNKLRYPHATERSYAGIDVTNVLGLTIGNGSLAAQTNTFDNLDYGVLGYDSNIDIYNNIFQNMTSPAVAIKDGECNRGTAVCVAGNPDVAVPRTVRVGSLSGTNYKNTFTNCGRGVIAYQNLNTYVNRNTMNNPSVNGGIGVRATKNDGGFIQINENEINRMAVGIDCYDNTALSAHIENNTIDAGTLLKANGIVAQAIYLNRYTISGNVIHNVRNGIIARNLASSDISTNKVYLKHTTTAALPCRGISIEGGAFNTLSANYVLGQNTNDSWIEGISLDLCYSNKVICNETHNVYSGLVFGGVQTPNTQIAKNTMDNDHQGFVLRFAEVGPQYTVVSGVNKPNDNQWTGTQTYHTFSFNSVGAFSPIYVRTVTGTYNPSPYLQSTFPASVPNIIPLISTSGNLNSLACPIIVPEANPAHMPLLLQIAEDSIVPPAYDTATRWMLKQSLYKYLKENPAAASAHPILTDFQNDHSNGSIGKLDHVERVMSDPAALNPSALASVKAENTSVLAANDAERNSKFINDVLIDNAIANANFTAAQLNDLRVLAAKCPYNDGQAVYQARAILSQFEETEYVNGCEVAQLHTLHNMLSAQITEEETMFNLYPNPNDGTMNFIYSLDQSSKGELILYDLTGKLIVKYVLQAGKNNQLFIQENQLNNGVYFYKVIVDNEVKASDKIVIIK